MSDKTLRVCGAVAVALIGLGMIGMKTGHIFAEIPYTAGWVLGMGVALYLIMNNSNSR